MPAAWAPTVVWWILVGLVACGREGSGAETGDAAFQRAPDAAVDAGPDGASSEAGADAAPAPSFCSPAPFVEVPAGATRKLCQLTGEDDRQLDVRAPNATDSRYGLWGTDLGASFEHGGRTFFLFGDSIPTGPGTPNAECGDAIATSEDTDASDCLALDFRADDGGTFRSPLVPGVSLGCYEVPLDGVSRGGSMFVWFSTAGMTRSILARSDDDAASFAMVHETSADRFVNVSAEIVPAERAAGLPGSGDRVVLFGSGTYRASHVSLAVAGLDEIEDRSAWSYFAGAEAGVGGEATDCAPRWSASESDATPLFPATCVGELSVHYHPGLGVWLLLYNCDEPRGVHVRAARDPWGPWSEPALLFRPWEDGGYCGFMHTSFEHDQCDDVSDPGRENEWGGEYGPYVVSRLSAEATGDEGEVVFVLSTWNPYNTVLMGSRVRATGP
jgi:hypothetical protein